MPVEGGAAGFGTSAEGLRRVHAIAMPVTAIATASPIRISSVEAGTCSPPPPAPPPLPPPPAPLDAGESLVSFSARFTALTLAALAASPALNASFVSSLVDATAAAAGVPLPKGDLRASKLFSFKRWQLDDYYYTNPQEYRMHSDALHTIERIRWKSKTALSYTITIDDPKIFTAPCSQEFEVLAKPEWDTIGLFEYVCDNNRCPGGKCSDK